MMVTKSTTDGSLLELSRIKIYKLVKFVRDHPKRAHPWQMGNLSCCIAVDTILKYLLEQFCIRKRNFSIDLTTVEY